MVWSLLGSRLRGLRHQPDGVGSLSGSPRHLWSQVRSRATPRCWPIWCAPTGTTTDPIAGDSDLAEGVKLLARAHQSAIWGRQRQLNALRSALREYYPGALAAFGTDLASTDALAVLADRPDSRARPGAVAIEDRLGAAQGRPPAQHRATSRGDPRLPCAPSSSRRPTLIAKAHGLVTRSALALIVTFNAQIAELEAALSEHFEQHPDAKVVLSLPGLGTVLGARVLGEFGDDRTRFSGPKSRKNYAGTSPVTKASGHSRVVLARFARNSRLGDACDQWAFCALNDVTGSPELLRPAPSQRQDPSPGPPTAGQPSGRNPPRLPGARGPLRRAGGLAREI